MIKVCFDLDGVLCEETPTFEKSLAEPYPRAIDKVNAMYDAGYFVMIYTSRGWPEYRMTEDWLKKHGFKFHLLMCGKPLYDILYDDKAEPLTFLK